VAPLTPDRWRALSPYLDEALAMPAHNRAAWLADIRARDAALASDLERRIAPRARRLLAGGGVAQTERGWQAAFSLYVRVDRRRVVTAHSVLLFHPLKWESGEHVAIDEAAEWARHFAHLETDMDRMLAKLLGITPEKLAVWMKPGRYVSGRELAEAGLAELVELTPRQDLIPVPEEGAGKKKVKK